MRNVVSHRLNAWLIRFPQSKVTPSHILYTMFTARLIACRQSSTNPCTVANKGLKICKYQHRLILSLHDCRVFGRIKVWTSLELRWDNNILSWIIFIEAVSCKQRKE